MARKRNKFNKAPGVSGFAKNSNNSKNASEREGIKREISEYNKSNELLEQQIELDGQKHEEEMLDAEEDYELQMKNMETKYNEAISKMDGLAEKVKSAQRSNADLESRMRQQGEDHSHELKVVKSRQEEDLTCLKAKLNGLEAENKELVERNELMAENEKKSKLMVKELEARVGEMTDNNKKLTADLEAMKDEQEQCLKRLGVTRAENNKVKEEIEALTQAATTNKENVSRLRQEGCRLSEEAECLEECLVEVKTGLRNEKVVIDDLKKKLGELVSKRKRSDEDLTSLKANIKEVDEDKKRTELQIQKVNEELESQAAEISTRNEENEKARKERDRLREEKTNMVEELLQVQQQIAKVKRAGFFRRLFKKY